MSDSESLEQDLANQLNEARKLSQQKNFEGALRAYIDVFEQSRGSAGFAGVRLSYVLAEINEMRTDYQPASEVLQKMRDEREKMIADGTASREFVFEWAAINDQIEPNRSKEFYDRFHTSPHGTIVEQIGLLVWKNLVKDRRYSEVSSNILHKKVDQLQKSIELLTEGSELQNKMKAESWQNATLWHKKHAREEGAMIYECALAQGNKELAERICTLVTDRFPAATTFVYLIEAANRCDHEDQALSLRELARIKLPLEEMEKL